MSEKAQVAALFENKPVQERLQAIAGLADRSGHYAPLVAQALNEVQSAENLTDALRALHLVQRLNDIAVLQLEESDAVFTAMQDEDNFPLWDRCAAFDIDDDEARDFATRMYTGDPDMQHPVLLVLADYARGIGEKTVQQIVQAGDGLDIVFTDDVFHRRMLREMNITQAEQYGVHAAQPYLNAARRIQIISGNPSVPFSDHVPDKHIADAYKTRFYQLRNEFTATQFFTLTYLPTPKDAELDGMEYGAYTKMFMGGVKVDEEKQNRANKVLIAKMNAASIVRITNSDGTDLTLDITGQTFANSLSRKNVPGSEVFSSPLIHSANGRIVARGKFMPMAADQIIEDITLDLKDGVVVAHDAAKGREYLAQMIERDEGSRRLGEFALGTNPALYAHSVNGLLVEKIGRSFHVAIGAAYENTDYMGEPVKLDNGNRSTVHWDITTMLHNKDGMIELDGVPIMQHGRYLDPELQFLNGPQ